MPASNTFYRVATDARSAPLRDYHFHGYDDRWEFYLALRRLVNRWKGRVGECVEERHGFRRLRFYDTAGGSPDEAWIPNYLLTSSEPPEYMNDSTEDDTEKELNDAFGFD